MMSASSTAMTPSANAIASSTSSPTTPAFWERLWRTSGLQFVGFFIITSVIHGYQPQIGAAPDELLAFYNGDRTRILIAAAFSGLNVLNLLWFAAALRTTLSEAGQDGWGAAATAASAAFGALTLLQIAVGAALAYSIAGSGNQALTSGLNDFVWALIVLSAFPRAMLIMSGVFGLWRAELISNAVLRRGSRRSCSVCWAAPRGSGASGRLTERTSRFISPLLLLLWVLMVSRVPDTRSRDTRGMVISWRASTTT